MNLMNTKLQILVGSSLISFLLSSGGAYAKTSQPNLVLVFVDDMGWGALPPNLNDFSEKELNQEFIAKHVKDYTVNEAFEACNNAMPFLKSLCNDGVRFTNAYVTANVSSPSRAGLLTASYQQRYGLYINPEAETGIPENILTMPRVLQKNGYVNGAFGKYHNGKGKDKIHTCSEGHHPLDRGFDYWFGFNCHGTSYYDSPIMFRNREHVGCPEYTTDKFTNEAIEFIQKHKDQPKLVYLAYNALHGPLGAPAPDKYLKRFNYKSKTLNNYAAYSAAVDDGVAAVINQLKEQGEADNTMVVFMSDNGAPGGGAATLPKNGPFSGFKGQSSEGGIRVPLFIWYGNKIKKGMVCDQIVSSMDIFPTFLDEINAKLPDQEIDGVSLSPILKGEKDYKPHEHLVWMSQQAENWGMHGVTDQKVAQACFIVRKDNFILRYHVEGNQFYLHDLSNDKQEKVNLINQLPEKADELKLIFKGWFSEMKPPLLWDEALWQNVQFWNKALPPAPPIDRSEKAMRNNKKRGKQQ